MYSFDIELFQVAVLRQREERTSSKWFIEVIKQFSLPRIICGLSAFDESCLLFTEDPTDCVSEHLISALTWGPTENDDAPTVLHHVIR